MPSFIEELKRSNNALLQNEAQGVELFRQLKHDKKGLDVLLKNAIVEILTSSKKRLVCTSNEMLVKKFSFIKDGAGLKRTIHSPFETSSRHSALTWDLLKNKYASIAGNSWVVLNFIVISESNVEILHKAITDLLSKTV